MILMMPNTIADNHVPIKGALHLDLHLFRELAILARVVNNKLRQKMLQIIHKKGVVTVTELRKHIKIQQSATSTHLKVLRDVGFVIAHREGQNVYYSINYKRLDEVQKLLRIFNDFK